MIYIYTMIYTIVINYINYIIILCIITSPIYLIWYLFFQVVLNSRCLTADVTCCPSTSTQVAVEQLDPTHNLFDWSDSDRRSKTSPSISATQGLPTVVNAVSHEVMPPWLLISLNRCFTAVILIIFVDNAVTFHDLPRFSDHGGPISHA